MNNSFGLKMIAVVNQSRLRLYEAQGIKITRKIEELPFSEHKEPRHEKGNFQKNFTQGSSQGSAYEPHTSIKDIEHHNVAKLAVSHIDKILAHNSDYKELMIAAEPKTLGHIRSELTNHLKKILTKEVVKDLAHQEMREIEQAFFS